MSKPAYPGTVTLSDGHAVTVRPIQLDDGERLRAFFLQLPAIDRFYMKEDPTAPGVIEGWTRNADPRRNFALLALADGEVVADAVLVKHRGGYRAKQGEVRINIALAYRGRGLGTAMIRALAEVAWDDDLEALDFELIPGAQDAAIEAARGIGAYEVGRLTGFVSDDAGAPADMLFLRVPLASWFRF